MQVNLVYFANVREIMQKSEETITLPDNIKTVADLKNKLTQENKNIANIYKILVAVNQNIVDDNTLLKHFDEVAFFPPVTGG